MKLSIPEIFERLSKAIVDADEEDARKVAEEAIAAGIDPVRAIKEGLAKGIAVVGEKFRKSEIFLPHVMLASDAMKAAIAVLESRIGSKRMSEVRLGKVVIGTAFGDIHDIGKNLVATMLSVAGFEVHDLGCDVPVMKFIETAEEVKADIIAISCLLSPSMFSQKDVVNYLKDMGIRGKYYVIVGGGSITPEWAKQIGVDGYGRYADDGTEICIRLVTEKPIPPLKEPIVKE